MGLFDADEWVVAEGASGSFLSTAVIPAAAGEEIEAARGVDRADRVVVSRTTLELDPDLDVNLIGYVPGGLGTPPVAERES